MVKRDHGVGSRRSRVEEPIVRLFYVLLRLIIVASECVELRTLVRVRERKGNCVITPNSHPEYLGETRDQSTCSSIPPRATGLQTVITDPDSVDTQNDYSYKKPFITFR